MSSPFESASAKAEQHNNQLAEEQGLGTASGGRRHLRVGGPRVARGLQGGAHFAAEPHAVKGHCSAGKEVFCGLRHGGQGGERSWARQQAACCHCCMCALS